MVGVLKCAFAIHSLSHENRRPQEKLGIIICTMPIFALMSIYYMYMYYVLFALLVNAKLHLISEYLYYARTIKRDIPTCVQGIPVMRRMSPLSIYLNCLLYDLCKLLYFCHFGIYISRNIYCKVYLFISPWVKQHGQVMIVLLFILFPTEVVISDITMLLQFLMTHYHPTTL